MRAALLLTLAFTASVAHADDAPQAVADYRHTVMEATKYHMKASAAIAKGAISRPGDLAGHARALHDTANTFDQLFPKGTSPAEVKTDALPAVWAKWDEFVKANEAFKKATGELVAVADKGDKAAIGAALKAVGESCGACHDTFRKEDD